MVAFPSQQISFSGSVTLVLLSVQNRSAFLRFTSSNTCKELKCEASFAEEPPFLADQVAVEAEGISARVINVPCLKPFPDEAIGALLQGVRAIVSCEEHSVIGGLSQALAWTLRGDGRPMDAVAVQDVFGQSAYTHEELLTHYHLNVADIADKAKSLLK